MVSMNDKLVGTWKLVSAASEKSAGESIESPYGANREDFLTHTTNGRVTVLISYGGRKPLSFGDGTKEEQAEAFNTFLAYAGRYTANGEKVTHPRRDLIDSKLCREEFGPQCKV
jgi:hypothetical protein